MMSMKMEKLNETSSGKILNHMATDVETFQRVKCQNNDRVMIASKTFPVFERNNVQGLFQFLKEITCFVRIYSTERNYDSIYLARPVRVNSCQLATISGLWTGFLGGPCGSFCDACLSTGPKQGIWQTEVCTLEERRFEQEMRAFSFFTIAFHSNNSFCCTIFRLKIAKHTDKRTTVMKEIIAGTRVVKMYCWETPYTKIIADIRK